MNLGATFQPFSFKNYSPFLLLSTKKDDTSIHTIFHQPCQWVFILSVCLPGAPLHLLHHSDSCTTSYTENDTLHRACLFLSIISSSINVPILPISSSITHTLILFNNHLCGTLSKVCQFIGSPQITTYSSTLVGERKDKYLLLAIYFLQGNHPLPHEAETDRDEEREF